MELEMVNGEDFLNSVQLAFSMMLLVGLQFGFFAYFIKDRVKKQSTALLSSVLIGIYITAYVVAIISFFFPDGLIGGTDLLIIFLSGAAGYYLYEYVHYSILAEKEKREKSKEKG